jgi:hypothetical protein
MRMRQLFREPILHFLVLGLLLFAGYRWKVPSDSAGRDIVITQGVVDDLVSQHVAAKGREPSTAELTGLIAAYVRDEILYREGVKLGLDRDDIVVKRRVRQKIELIAEEDASTGTPSDADLSAYLAAHQARFVQPAVLTFEQRGTSLLLPRRMTQTPADLVAREFGNGFSDALEKVPVGEWAGPIDSSFGAHYVRVSERTPAVSPPLAAVRDQVVREWENERRQRSRNEAYAKMRGEYQVRIETERATERR